MAITHDCAGVSVPPTMSLMKSLSIRTLPPLRTSSNKIPWNNKTFASVTTNDGIPTLATMNPVNSPRRTATPNAASSASGNDQPPCSRVARTAADTPAVKPADRSMSPSSSTKVTAMAITITDDA